jgi:hypothetical protein
MPLCCCYVLSNRSDELNYVGAKVVARIDSYIVEHRENPEEAGVNYYRQFVESSLQRHISIPNRVRIFHTVNASWIFAIYAGMWSDSLFHDSAGIVGVPSIVVFHKYGKAVKDFLKLPKHEQESPLM